MRVSLRGGLHSLSEKRFASESLTIGMVTPSRILIFARTVRKKSEKKRRTAFWTLPRRKDTLGLEPFNCVRSQGESNASPET